MALSLVHLGSEGALNPPPRIMPNILTVTKTGKVVDSRTKELTDLLWGLREKPFWLAVEKVVKVWTKSNPEEWDSFLFRLEGIKEVQKKKPGSWGKEWRGISTNQGITRTHVVDFPIWIYLCLKKMYPERHKYLASKEFYRKFGRKFPVFRIFKQV